ncbi:MAG: cupin domain-containing protein [Actinomycetota bacterium]|nr:cupin domain-containing protein [Actinomycetota bacterium]
MIEKTYKFNKSDQKLIEKIINDENVNINHMILYPGDNLPAHNSNSNVYLIITKGTMDIALDQQPPASYQSQNIVNVPFKTRMNIRNKGQQPLEFLCNKGTPSPGYEIRR